MLDRNLQLHQDASRRLLGPGGQAIAEDCLPFQLINRRFERNSARAIKDDSFIDEHESVRTKNWNVPRLFGQQPTPEQARHLNSLPDRPIVRLSYGDGYLRTERIVAAERSIRPYNRSLRNARSMQFAESVGASTDADNLEFDNARPGEGDLYRTQRQGYAHIERLSRASPSSDRDGVVREVLQVLATMFGTLQSRMARMQPTARRRENYEQLRDTILALPMQTYRRAFLDVNNRQTTNALLRPLIRIAVETLLNRTWARRTRDLVEYWLGRLTAEIINLKDMGGRVRSPLPRPTIPQRRQAVHECSKPWGGGSKLIGGATHYKRAPSGPFCTQNLATRPLRIQRIAYLPDPVFPATMRHTKQSAKPGRTIWRGTLEASLPGQSTIHEAREGLEKIRLTRPRARAAALQTRSPARSDQSGCG